MTPYTLPEPVLMATVPFYDGRDRLYNDAQMHAAFAAGAASRDDAFEQAERDYRAKCSELEIVHSELDALRADAESWRKYKARKDAVLAAGMGRNPLRTEAQRKSDAFDSLPDDYEVN